MNGFSSVEQTPLAIARRKKGWTQAYVAEKVGVSVDAVRRWESGRLPYPASIQRLCMLFAMNPQELGLFIEPPQPDSEGWSPLQAEKQAAWEIYVEMVTRVPMITLENDQGLLREVLASFYTLFQITRTILRQLGPIQVERSVSHLAVNMLNLALRPFLSRWHPLLKDYEDRRPVAVGTLEYERQWEHYEALRLALITLRPTLMSYADAFAKIAGTSSIIVEAHLE